MNAGSDEDDEVFRTAYSARPKLPNVEMKFIRQIGGKRQGLATCLAHLMKEKVDVNDALVLMDGDTVYR